MKHFLKKRSEIFITTIGDKSFKNGQYSQDRKKF